MDGLSESKVCTYVVYWGNRYVNSTASARLGIDDGIPLKGMMEEEEGNRDRVLYYRVDP